MFQWMGRASDKPGLWQWSSLWIRRALQRLSRVRCSQEAYLLHPRCCLAEQSWESL
jgi:hypothetical protein